MLIHYTEIDRQQTPLGEVTLHRYWAESGEVGYEIRIEDQFLMASHGAGGEVTMAQLAYERLERKEGLCALVGGLGPGHTLRALLNLPGISRVSVAEISSKVVEWARTLFADVNGAALYDPRVEIVLGDILDLLRTPRGQYDLFLLDVDNGPEWLAAEGNSVLYTAEGLALCRKALKPQGVLAIWSPSDNPALMTSLQATFDRVEVVENLQPLVDKTGPTDTIYLAW